LRPEGGDDVGAPRSPVEAGDDGAFDPEGVHQGDHVVCERRLLAVAERLVRKEASRSEAAQEGDDHPVAGGRQWGDDVGVAVDVVRPAVQQDDRGSVCRPPVDISDVQGTGVDLPEVAEQRLRSDGDGHFTLQSGRP
jgi:hypothetical protein